MSTILNDTRDAAKSTMDAAKSTLDSAKDKMECAADTAKEGTQHAVSSARSSLMDGIHAVNGVVSLVRNLQLNDALGWIGLSRRRDNTFTSLALFGAGMVVGTGVGMLFAPTSGSDLRRNLFGRLKGLEKDAERAVGDAGTAVKDRVKDIENKIENKAGDLVGKAKDVEHKAEDYVGKAKDAVAGKADDIANKAKDVEHKAEDYVGKAKDAVAGKADDIANKAKDVVNAKQDDNKSRDTLGNTERKQDEFPAGKGKDNLTGNNRPVHSH